MSHRVGIALVVAAGALVITMPAKAAFHIEYPAGVLAEEKGLMGNRTHYEQKGQAAFRMTDAQDTGSALERYQADGAKLVLDLGYRPIIHRGTANNEQRVRAFADDVPLRTAMTLIVPGGWKVVEDKSLKSVRLNETVSFEGNLLWTDALYAIGERYGFQFEVDWTNSIVNIKQGRDGIGKKAGRIRIIEEPDVVASRKGKQPEPVASVRPVEKNEPAKVFAAPAGERVAGGLEKSEGTALAQDKAVATNATKGAGQAVATKAAVQPEPVKPVEVAPRVVLTVQKGTLFQNVERLSKEHGWKAPRWDIASDFSVSTQYTLDGPTFEAAMFKLLSIHPIEAEINQNQRIVYVLRELN